MKFVKAFSVAEVVWNDSHGGDEGWLAAKDMDNNKHHGPKKIVSVGHVVRHDAVGITLALNHVVEDKAVSSYIFIPQNAIVSVKDLIPRT